MTCTFSRLSQLKPRGHSVSVLSLVFFLNFGQKLYAKLWRLVRDVIPLSENLGHHTAFQIGTDIQVSFFLTKNNQTSSHPNL